MQHCSVMVGATPWISSNIWGGEVWNDVGFMCSQKIQAQHGVICVL
jgi:hypothetical protein